MQKLLQLLLVIAMIFALCSCGSEPDAKMSPKQLSDFIQDFSNTLKTGLEERGLLDENGIKSFYAENEMLLQHQSEIKTAFEAYSMLSEKQKAKVNSNKVLLNWNARLSNLLLLTDFVGDWIELNSGNVYTLNSVSTYDINGKDSRNGWGVNSSYTELNLGGLPFEIVRENGTVKLVYEGRILVRPDDPTTVSTEPTVEASPVQGSTPVDEPPSLTVETGGTLDTSVAVTVTSSKTYTPNRFYGIWVDEMNNGAVFTLSSKEASYEVPGSYKSTSVSPELSVEGNTLHTNLYQFGQDFAISEEDGNLYLTNNQMKLRQQIHNPESGSAAQSSIPSEPVQVQMNETITTDFATLKFTNFDVMDSLEVKESLVTSSGGSGGNISSRMIIESERSGTKYLVLKGTISNSYNSVITPTKIRTRMIVNGEIELSDCKITLISQGSNTSMLQPLNEGTLYIDAAISESILSSVKSVSLFFGFEPYFTGTQLGDPSLCQNYYYLPLYNA